LSTERSAGRLAIEGGPPVRPEFLPFHRPSLGREEETEVLDALRSGWLTTGPRTQRFEADFARYLGARYARGVTSCTAAMHLALVALRVGPGDEVITSPITFPATANVVVHVGATPVFVDVEPATLNLDVEQLEARITPRTKAIIPVHFAGHPCRMDALAALARRHGLAIVEDCAHAIEATFEGRHVGTWGNAGAFSFYATKSITTGEGGMLVTEDEDLAERIGVLRLHGISRDAWKRYGQEGFRHYETLSAGFKYNMSDLQAALGLAQFPKLEAFWARRQSIVKAYDDALAAIPQLRRLEVRGPVRHSHHLYVVIVQTEELSRSRDEILDAIQKENVGLGVHFRAVHLQPFYREQFGFRPGQLPAAEYASERVISLPLYPAMEDRDVEDTITAVTKVVLNSRRSKTASPGRSASPGRV
jgi:dTDP-4-amino-4,6-dideoxygalactose transaminase